LALFSRYFGTSIPRQFLDCDQNLSVPTFMQSKTQAFLFDPRETEGVSAARFAHSEGVPEVGEPSAALKIKD
jgi:hypothetical protein